MKFDCKNTHTQIFFACFVGRDISVYNLIRNREMKPPKILYWPFDVRIPSPRQN